MKAFCDACTKRQFFMSERMIISFILPAKNEAENLDRLLPKVNAAARDFDYEVIVVNDGSSDNTSEICEKWDVIEVKHPYSKGNGAAIKSGARQAKGEIFVFLDADGQHDPSHFKGLVDMLLNGYDMVVGARSISGQASTGRAIANGFYNVFASYVVGQKIDDLTSGYRVVWASQFKEYLYLLPNKFSYPTTITIMFFRAGLSVGYLPIDVAERGGSSHISPLKDGVRFLIIVFKIGVLYSPLKIFAPVASLFFMMGLTWYGYTFYYLDRFTNMSALLLTAGVITFMIGLLSEQVAMLLYKNK